MSADCAQLSATSERWSMERHSESEGATGSAGVADAPSALLLEQRKLELAIQTAADDHRLRTRELDLREAELRKPVWRDPVFVGVMAAALSVTGSLWVTNMANKSAHDLAESKAREEQNKANADTVTALIRNVDAATAKRNLQVAITVGLVKDDDGKIASSLERGVFLTLPPPAQAQQSSFPTAKGNSPGGTITVPGSSETLLLDQNIVVPNGGYALTENPTCPIEKMEDAPGIAQALARGDLATAYPGISLDKPAGPTGTSFVAKSRGGRGGAASCGIIAFTVPDTFKVIRMELSAGESSGGTLPCIQQVGPAINCDVGWAAWTSFFSGSEAVAIFKNWSGDRTRSAHIRIFGLKIVDHPN
jgi:hypothetical protein